MPKFRPDDDQVPQPIAMKPRPLKPRVEVIAEVGTSHSGKIERALLLIYRAAQAGVSTCKFQLWGEGELWHKSDSRCKMTDTFALPEAWLQTLSDRCRESGVEFLCTPFSPNAVWTLEKLGVKRYKVSSGDVTYIPLLTEIAKTGKPVLLSTGFSTNEEIQVALETLRPSGRCETVTLMGCVGGYPTAPKDANLKHLLDLAQEFSMKYDCHLGWSSHMKEWWVDLVAIAYNAEVIEKHIRHEALEGLEDGHSLKPSEMEQFVKAVRDTELALKGHSGFCDDDLYARANYRRNPEDWLRPVER